MAHGDEQVLLGVASSEVEANIWRDALEQEGVRPFVRSRSVLSSLGGGAVFAEYEVFVMAHDVKRARWIIGDRSEPDMPGREEEQETAAAD